MDCRIDPLGRIVVGAAYQDGSVSGFNYLNGVLQCFLITGTGMIDGCEVLITVPWRLEVPLVSLVPLVLLQLCSRPTRHQYYSP